MAATLLTYLLLFAAPFLSVATDYYVKPTEPPSTACPGTPCHTLQEYVTTESHYFSFVSNVTVNLLPGVHELNTSIAISNVRNFVFVAFGDTAGPGDLVVVCNSVYNRGCDHEIVHSINVALRGFTLINQHGFLHTVNVSQVSMHNISLFSTSLVFVRGVSDLHMFQVFIDGGGIQSYSGIVGNSSIVQMHIKNSSGLYFYTGSLLTQDSHLSIKECTFEDYTGGGPQFTGAIGIQIEPSNFNVEIDIDHVIVQRGNVYLYIGGRQKDQATVRISDSYIGHSSFPGVYIVSLDGPHYNASGSIYISSCQIIGHSQGGISIDFYSGYVEVAIVNSTVQGNILNGLPGLYQKLNSNFAAGAGLSLRSNLLLFNSPDVCKPHSVTLTNVSFEFNTFEGVLGPLSAVVALFNTDRCILFTDCKFHGNIGTPIYASSNPFDVAGEVSFTNNTAFQGGAITFVGYPPDKTSFMYANENSNIIFQDNSVSNGGGAIYVADTTRITGFFQGADLYQPCFFTAGQNVNLNFINNRAGIGGNAIYGPFMTYGRCDDTHSLSFEGSAASNLTAVTSDPSRVCFCKHGRPDCTSVFLEEDHYPGQTFNISAVVVGEMFGTVTGSVYARFFPLTQSTEPTLAELQQAQAVGHEQCGTLTYTVYSGNDKEVLVLRSNEEAITGFPDSTRVNQTIARYRQNGIINQELLTLPIYVNISLRSCPLGFTHSDAQQGCVCDPQLQEANIPCSIDTQTVRRSGSVWVNASFAGNASNGVIVHMYCPFRYCKAETVDINLIDPDTQCDLDHSGTLCGSCKPGLSLALGTSQCLPCSNYWAFLSIAFAVAGFVLVLIIRVLNLTVSVGTINGLILYTNIIGGTQAIWFPAGETNVLTVFIAWLNLDLGIETCFIDGLDGYWKTWLQFVFPVYVWTIVLAVVFGARYYTWVGKVAGRNSVPMLSTLFLLSYTKLLRIIITIFTFTTLEYPDGSHVVVWAYDANYTYLGRYHAPLFAVALLVLVFLFLPYTMILLLGQCLQRTNLRVFALVYRLKPVFDAYFGPFKDECRYWVGVLLLVRCVLLITYSVSAVNAPNANLLVIAATMLVLLQYSAINIPKFETQEPRSRLQELIEAASQLVGLCYKKWYLSLLESSFILNLGILAAGTLYVRLGEGNPSALVDTLVGFAFVQFLLIVLIHAIVYLPKLVPGKTVRLVYHRDLDRERRTDNAHITGLREPILEYTNI